MKDTIILALDQATLTGWTLMQNGEIIACGTEDFGKVKGFTKRIVEIKKWVMSKIEDNGAVIIGIEDTQLQTNSEVFKKLTKLLGNLEVLMLEENIEFYTVSASEWKSTCKVKGRAREEQKANAIKFVNEQFGLEVDSDTADSICLAWHVWKKILKGQNQ